MARYPEFNQPTYQTDGNINVVVSPAQPLQLLTFGEPAKQIAVIITALSAFQDSIRVVGHLQVGVIGGGSSPVYWLAGVHQPVVREEWYIYAFNRGDGLGQWVNMADPAGDTWPILCFGFSPAPSLRSCEYLLKGWL